MAGYGDKPFGLRDLKLTKIDGSVQVDLPYGMTLSFKERVTSGELRGDDATVSIVAITDAAEWSIEAGGISLEAYALMTGRSVVTAGTTPNRTTTLSANAGESRWLASAVFPWGSIRPRRLKASAHRCSHTTDCIC